MADFCACCTVQRLGVEPEKNDLNRNPEMNDSDIDFSKLGYNDLCEGCGGVFVDEKGWPMNFDSYNIAVGQYAVHNGKDEVYEILNLANGSAPEYPSLVVYKRLRDGEVFARSVNVFVRKFRPRDGSWYGAL